MNSLPPSSLATLIAPNVFGTLNLTYDYWGPMWDTMPEGTYTDRAVNYLFAGTLPLVLLLWQGLARGRLFVRDLRFPSFWASPHCFMPSADTRPSSSCCSTISPVSSSTVARPTRRSSSTSRSRFCAGYCVHRYIMDGGEAAVARTGAAIRTWRRPALIGAAWAILVLARRHGTVVLLACGAPAAGCRADLRLHRLRGSRPSLLATQASRPARATAAMLVWPPRAAS